MLATGKRAILAVLHTAHAGNFILAFSHTVKEWTQVSYSSLVEINSETLAHPLRLAYLTFSETITFQCSGGTEGGSDNHLIVRTMRKVNRHLNLLV